MSAPFLIFTIMAVQAGLAVFSFLYRNHVISKCVAMLREVSDDDALNNLITQCVICRSIAHEDSRILNQMNTSTSRVRKEQLFKEWKTDNLLHHLGLFVISVIPVVGGLAQFIYFLNRRMEAINYLSDSAISTALSSAEHLSLLNTKRIEQLSSETHENKYFEFMALSPGATARQIANQHTVKRLPKKRKKIFRNGPV